MNEHFKQTDFLFAGNAVFVEELYELYLTTPDLVDQNWQAFFQILKNSSDNTVISKGTVHIINCAPTEEPNISPIGGPCAVDAMINSYRKYAHYLARLDPLKLEVTRNKSDLKLNPENFGFNTNNLNQVLNGQYFGKAQYTMNKLIHLLDQTYCAHIAVEFEHVAEEVERDFLYDKLENEGIKFNLSAEEQKNVLNDLVEIEGFEQYLHTKFPGAKRFSVEGAESSVVAIDKAVDYFMDYGAESVVLGMAHRGRLGTVTKILGKPYRSIIAGFITGNALPEGLNASGDVKYHLGYSSDRIRGDKKIHLSMADNPSHLEAVNPVVAGKVRAKQDEIKDLDRKKVRAILVHGDSAFCGQGVVAESLSMSNLAAYTTGGILHLVVNNQLGFTANAEDTRSSRYSTEFAKIVAAPILHVNGDDVEAVLKVMSIASQYQQKFAKDIVVEIICYRKYGHNEGDEPMYTQGVMYNIIKHKPSPAAIYANHLQENKIIDDNYFATLKENFKIKLDQEYDLAKNYTQEIHFLDGLWSGYTREVVPSPMTGVSKKILQGLGNELCSIPDNFALNPKLLKLFEARKITLKEDKPIDWATAEQLAFASLLTAGTNIRLTGQDSGRGTFSHRHSVLHDQTNDAKYIPLNHLASAQARYEVADSHLSEYAVLGFEYGYSLVDPRNLVIWEAQFGDFCNGAQIIFDQFISSSETKWLRMSGIVVLLPHGFEGQGPEHSSARLERFLQLSAENNIQVTYPTTPASFFHLLRRQILSTSRKPLIVMTPKSLLRHRLAVSNLASIDEGTSFAPILDDINDIKDYALITKMVLCSGKVYYDLLEMQQNEKITDVAIIRLEQLYPLENNILIKLFKKYNKVTKHIWCQEEPRNMGAWSYIHPHLNDCLNVAEINGDIQYVGRTEASSPATGALHIHNQQQEQLVKEALM